MDLNIYMMPVITESLGPYKRCAFWVQGCKKRCKGCIAKEAQSLDGGQKINVEELAEYISKQDDIEGITISGGEPFLQQDAICELIDVIRTEKDLGIIIYTGMNYQEISETQLSKKCDLIIDGEYVDELNDDKSLRGSSNQNIICVSERYKDCVDTYYGVPGRKVEIIQRNKSFDLVGIPSRNLLENCLNK